MLLILLLQKPVFLIFDASILPPSSHLLYELQRLLSVLGVSVVREEKGKKKHTGATLQLLS